MYLKLLNKDEFKEYVKDTKNIDNLPTLKNIELFKLELYNEFIKDEYNSKINKGRNFKHRRKKLTELLILNFLFNCLRNFYNIKKQTFEKEWDREKIEQQFEEEIEEEDRLSKEQQEEIELLTSSILLSKQEIIRLKRRKKIEEIKLKEEEIKLKEEKIVNIKENPKGLYKEDSVILKESDTCPFCGQGELLFDRGNLICRTCGEVFDISDTKQSYSQSVSMGKFTPTEGYEQIQKIIDSQSQSPFDKQIISIMTLIDEYITNSENDKIKNANPVDLKGKIWIKLSEFKKKKHTFAFLKKEVAKMLFNYIKDSTIFLEKDLTEIYKYLDIKTTIVISEFIPIEQVSKTIIKNVLKKFLNEDQIKLFYTIKEELEFYEEWRRLYIKDTIKKEQIIDIISFIIKNDKKIKDKILTLLNVSTTYPSQCKFIKEKIDI